jgi:capsular exopolysaccharide synthesis family protein
MTATILTGARPAPEPHPLDRRLVSLVKPDSFEADQYRMLRYSVEQACPDVTSRVVAVTSAVPGDGKTFTAINLAGAIAKAGQARVLLVDADLRRPSIGSVLGQRRTGRTWGLVDAIHNRALTLDHIAWTLEPFNLSVITARRPHADTYELLASARFHELITAARERFDYIILDTPPVLPAPDSRLLAPVIDGYLIVVSADKTPRRFLEETLALLGPAKILGLVFNRESLKHSRYGRYYYAYTSSSAES